MYRFILLFFISALSLAAIPAGIVEVDSSENNPTRDTPRELAKMWLRFHEADLCQGVDAVFTFNKNGLEVRSLVEDERSYLRFQELLRPLRDSYRIELSATRPPPEEKSDKDEDPPPSLWENYALRYYLGDPVARAKELEDSEILARADPSVLDKLLKSRLLIFAEQTLDWSKKMERYAADLPALVHVASDASAAHELRSQASKICSAHARSLGRYIEKLDNNLSHALPQPATRERSSPRQGKSAVERALVESAMNISVTAHNVAARIYRFIYPEHYTVDLDELRQSSLLEVLRELRRMNADFQKAVGKSVRE